MIITWTFCFLDLSAAFVLIMSTCGLFEKIRTHGIRMHQYADDTQLIHSFNRSVTANAFTCVESARRDIREWY